MKRAIVLICSNPENLRKACPDVTVEAEYGDVLVEGRVLTLAHHGKNSGNEPPCVAQIEIRVSEKYRGRPEDDGTYTIGLSHLDLDALGGTLEVIGGRRTSGDAWRFWVAAGKVDVSGPHHLSDDDPDHDRLAAFWAWSEEHRCYPPRDGSVLDVTTFVEEARQAVDKILNGDPALIEAGRAFMADEEALNKSSFVKGGRVLLRQADGFVNHLYRRPDGGVAAAVVGFNPKTAAVTVSTERPFPGVSAKDIVQKLWGPEAGGRDVIAGSPRNRKMTMEDAEAAFQAVSVHFPERHEYQGGTSCMQDLLDRDG